MDQQKDPLAPPFTVQVFEDLHMDHYAPKNTSDSKSKNKDQ